MSSDDDEDEIIRLPPVSTSETGQVLWGDAMKTLALEETIPGAEETNPGVQADVPPPSSFSSSNSSSQNSQPGENSQTKNAKNDEWSEADEERRQKLMNKMAQLRLKVKL